MQGKQLVDIQSRLLIQAFIAHLANFSATSSILYSLCSDFENLKYFLLRIVEKSLCAYFYSKIQKCQDENIFQKDTPSNFSKEQIETILSKIEEKWK